MHTTDKKTERNRLLLYLIFSFGLAWAAMLAFILTGHKWDVASEKLKSFVGLAMLAPAAANLLTRWLTKEGFSMTGKGSLLLGIDLKQKKWIYYGFAMIMPWILFELGYALMLVCYPQLFDKAAPTQLAIGKDLLPFLPILTIVQTSLLSFAALGEELGWRAYLMPKLIGVCGRKKALLLGGVIWGLWHAPLTCIGHNFGTEYPGFPYLGILLMCIECTMMGTILTWLTIRVGSVWPAAIMHAVNNGTPSILACFVSADRMQEIFQGALLQYVFLLIPLAILAGICLLLWKKESQQM